MAFDQDGYGGILTITQEHHEIHEGNHFFIDECESMSLSQEIRFVITIGDTEQHTHMTMFFNSTAAISVTLWEGINGTIAGGSPIASFNSNRNKKSDIATTTFLKNPDPGLIGILKLKESSRGSFTGVAGGPGSIELPRNKEIILEKNNKYLLSLISGQNNNIVCQQFEWYEEGLS